MKCLHCQIDAGRLSKELACCQLRLLANAPPHVQEAVEAQLARRGWDKVLALRASLREEKARLAKLRQGRALHHAKEWMHASRFILQQ